MLRIDWTGIFQEEGKFLGNEDNKKKIHHQKEEHYFYNSRIHVINDKSPIILQIMTDRVQNNTSENLCEEPTEIVQAKAFENPLSMATNIERVPLNSLKR